MDVLVMAGQLILSLSILVVLHEFGHYLPAKWFGCRVEKFYLFFDPYFELFKKKIGETEWGIGWLPLGGYVKISGMVDESLDMDQLQGEPQPWEFRSKPAWQRLIIMLGGVTVNFILGFAIFAGLLYVYGTQTLPTANVPQGIYADSLGVAYGFQSGDKVLAVGDTELPLFGDRYLKREVLFNGARDVLVERDGREVTIMLPDSFQSKLTNEQFSQIPLYTLPLPLRVDTLLPNGTAIKSEMRKGDVIIAANGQPVSYLQDFRNILENYDGKEINLTVDRNGEVVRFPVDVGPGNRLGFGPNAENEFQFETKKYSLAEAIPKGVENGLNEIKSQGRAFGQMFAGNIKVRESVGSVFTIGKAFGGADTWSWQRFWSLTGLLSLILAVMNLLPIPALDGGHVMFLLYEVITGRKPNDKFLQIATTAGAIFLMALMALVLLNDVLKFF